MKIELKSLFPTQTDVPGFDIKLKQLSQEQYALPITLDRIYKFQQDAGEDFLDTLDFNIYVTKLVAGFLMAKYPEIASKINEASTYNLYDVYKVFDDNYELSGEDFYKGFCEVINYTDITKAKINQVLIQVEQYYS